MAERERSVQWFFIIYAYRLEDAEGYLDRENGKEKEHIATLRDIIYKPASDFKGANEAALGGALRQFPVEQGYYNHWPEAQ
jgi:hypothetical protein